MKNKIVLFSIIAIVLAILGGIFLKDFMNSISFIGTIYINLLKFMIIPIIFTSITITMFKSKDMKGKLIIKSILLFILMFIITFLLTSLITLILHPGKGFIFNTVNWEGQITNLKISDIITNLFPSNIVTILQNNSIFPTIILAIAFGIASSRVEKGKYVIDILDGIKNILYKILEYIMYITPIGIFSLVGSAIANYGFVIFNVGIKYILMAYLCSIITLFLVMILPVWIIKKINPITYIKKVAKVWLMTLTTCSSLATLPTTIKTCNEEFNVDKSTTDIVVPLGCTIHMCGGAVSFALLGIFCSQLFGIEITISTFLLMIASATIINMAAPGIPNGGIVIGATYLSLLGIPLTFIGFYSGIYKLLDMAYTTLNVTGDVTANIILDKSLN